MTPDDNTPAGTVVRVARERLADLRRHARTIKQPWMYPTETVEVVNVSDGVALVRWETAVTWPIPVAELEIT